MIADLTAESEPDGFEAALERAIASAADRDVVLHRGTAIQQGPSPWTLAREGGRRGRTIRPTLAPDATVTDPKYVRRRF